MAPQTPDVELGSKELFDADEEREALLTSEEKPRDLGPQDDAPAKSKATGRKYALGHVFMSFVGGAIACGVAQYVFRSDCLPLSVSKSTPHGADDLYAAGLAGSTQVHKFPPTSPTNAFPSLFPTNIGFEGATPTGAEPALVITAPVQPLHTGAAQLVVPQAAANDKGGKGKGNKTKGKKGKFEMLKLWGNLSPWYSVDRVDYGGPASFAGRLHAADLETSKHLNFLNDWTYKLGEEVLTPFGRQQLFDLGISMRMKYGFLLENFTETNTIPVFRTESQHRMLHSALNFAIGFFGLPLEDKYQQSVIIEANGYNSTFSPYKTCPNSGRREIALRGILYVAEWSSIYLADARARLNSQIKGYELSIDDVYTMQQLCAYETVALGYSKFCELFTEEEWEGFNYSMDLYFWYNSGFGYALSTPLGIGYIQELVARLTKTPIATHNSSTNATLNDNPITFPLGNSLYVDATHEVVVLYVITALNLTSLAGGGPLPADHIPENRTFRSAELAPFATNIQFQLLSCESVPEPQIRVIINDGVVPLTGLRGCPKQKDGMCPVSTFVEAQKATIAETDWEWACHDGDATAHLAAQLASRPIAQDLHTLPLHRISVDYPGIGNLSCGDSSLFIEDISFAPTAEAVDALAITDHDDVFGPFSFETPPRASSRENELENLRNANRTLKADLVEVTKEAADARSALYGHMTKSAYQDAQIRNFKADFQRYQCIDGLLARVGLHKAVINDALAVLAAGGNPADVIVLAIERANPKTVSKSPLASPTNIGPRSQEQYVAALNMTLNVRKELKSSKKVTKFWKRVAQEDGLHADVITPSPSNVSSICQYLSPERQKAVDALIAKRRGNIAISESHSAASLATAETTVSAASINEPPLSASVSDSSNVSTIRSILPPLASDSIKQELAQRAGNKKPFSGPRSNSRSSVLRAIDMNVSASKRAAQRVAERRNVPVAPVPHPHRRYPSAASDSGSIRIKQKKPRSDTARSFVAAVSASLRRSKSKRKVSRRSRDDAENRASFDNTAFQPEVISVPSDPSFSSHASSSSNTSQSVENRHSSYEHGASLGHISEETGSAFEDDEAEESFASQATATTGPTTPSKTPKLQSESPPAMKSKLPVLKYLRRLSPLSSPSKVQKEKEKGDGLSPSKLPRRAGSAYTSPVRPTFAA
ncbi:hypothetical protein HWV62_40611 [Athelia sp. TMB]|nr:hypothetical protein HWV62_40611 [Athelia sp. TMB]